MASMTVNRIRRLITERVAYKPGWSFSCSGSRYDSECQVEIMWAQLQTNPSNLDEDGQYGSVTSPNSESFYINVDDVDSEVDVLRLLLEHCIYLEAKMLTHEAREFLRVKPELRWDAPFHPHHIMGDDEIPDGMNGKTNWRTTAHRQLEQNTSLPDL